MHLVEGSNTDEFFVAAQWKQYSCYRFGTGELKRSQTYKYEKAK
jgi:hypothetical protein